MKILFAGRPHAVVKSIDTSRAAEVEGVVAEALGRLGDARAVERKKVGLHKARKRPPTQ